MSSLSSSVASEAREIDDNASPKNLAKLHIRQLTELDSPSVEQAWKIGKAGPSREDWWHKTADPSVYYSPECEMAFTTYYEAKLTQLDSEKEECDELRNELLRINHTKDELHVEFD